MSFDGDLYPSVASKVITSKGDLVRGDASGDRERYGIGSAGQVLQVASSLPTWATINLADSVLTTQGDVLYEGASALARLGQSTANYTLATKGAGANPAWQASATSVLTTTGDLLYASGANTLARLAGGTSGDVLTAQGAGVAPSYQTPSGGGAWTERANVTLTGGASTIDSSTFTTDNNIMFSAFIKVVTTVGNIEMQLNNDTSANYCFRGFTNGGTSFSSTGQNDARIHDDSGTELEFYIQGFIYNIAGSEKLILTQSCQNTGAGTGATLTQCLITNKWVNTSAQCNQIVVKPSENTIDTGSNLTVWTAS